MAWPASQVPPTMAMTVTAPTTLRRYFRICTFVSFFLAFDYTGFCSN
jgi:hypothetical protein